MRRTKFNEAKYIAFLKEAHAVRSYVAKNPGLTAAKIKSETKIKRGLFWLYCKGYVIRKGGGDQGEAVYFVKPL